jgi:hypothetical protein
MQPEPNIERDGDRQTEDEIAQADLGGPRGSRELQPAEMTPRRRKIDMPTEQGFEPGHVA